MERVIPDVFGDLEVGVALHDPETGEVVGVNERLAEMYGYSAAEIREMGVEGYSVTDEGFTQEAIVERVRAATGGEPQTFEWHVERADGSTVWVRVRLAGTTLDGQEFVLAEVRDVTARKRSERERRDRQAFVDSLVEAIPDVFYAFDESGQLYEWNDRLTEVTGYTDEEVAEMTPVDFFPEDEQERISETMGRIMSQEEPARVEADCRTKDGERIPYEFSGGPVYDGEGNVTGTAGVGRDITERRKRQRELREQREILDQISENLDDVIWMSSPDKEEMEFVSAAYEDVWGRSVESLYETPGSFVEAIHEADRGRVVDALEEQRRDPGSYDETYRVVQPDGEVRWVHDRAFGIHDEDSRLRRVVGIASDVTERKEREQQLTRLHGDTRTLHRAETPQAVADITTGTVTETLGYPMNSVHLYDEASDSLVPAAVSGAVREHLGDPPALDEGLAWDAFQAGETHVYDDLGETDAAYNPATDAGSEMFVPLGGHGVLIIGSLATGAFDEADSSLVEILAANVESTLDRMTQERKYQRLTERISDAYYAFDDEWRVTYWNDTVAKRQDVPAEEVVGEPFWELYPELEDTEYGRTLREAMKTGEPQTCEFYYEPDDYWIKLQAYPDEDGLAVISTDVTDRKRREQQLEESNERLQRFAYVLSHDLQEPLRMVSSYIDLLETELDEELDEETREYMEFAVDGADRMQAMIDGLLRYSRVETRGEAFESTDLDTVLDDVRRDLEFLLDDADAAVQVDDLPTVSADPDQMGQLFQNLLKNSVEHGGSGTAIDVTASESDDAYEIRVTDDGPGIPAEEQDEMFGLFEKGGDSDGTGIGLAVCERIVDRHGGQIRVDSAAGEGATFVITLPKRAD